MNKSSKDQAYLFPISMSNLSNSSSQKQEEIKLEIVNNNNLEGKLKIKAGRDRLHFGALELRPVRGSDELPVIAMFSDNPYQKFREGRHLQ